MNDIDIKVLDGVKIEIMHKALLEAFFDYAIQVSFPLEKFQTMIKRRGFSSALSMGAFEVENDNNMVGFIFNSLREWNGKRTVYDTGTGVIPAYREQGITTRLFNETMKILARNGVEQYLLEVLKENDVAYEIYKKQGFQTTRTFSLFALKREDFTCNSVSSDNVLVSGIAPNEWNLLKEFVDFQPSWQNSIESINAVPDNYIYIIAKDGDECVGYGIMEKESGDVPQFAVKSGYRNKGIGSSIIASLMEQTLSPTLRFANIDDTCESCIGFLNKIGAEITGGQYEMILQLD